MSAAELKLKFNVSGRTKTVLSGWEQKPEGNLPVEVEPKPKLNPRSCAKKEEKGKFLHAASRAVD